MESFDGDSLTDENGHTTDGITLIRIEGFDGTVKKEYHQMDIILQM